jgi:hypothetical protein
MSHPRQFIDLANAALAEFSKDNLRLRAIAMNDQWESILMKGLMTFKTQSGIELRQCGNKAVYFLHGVQVMFTKKLPGNRNLFLVSNKPKESN